jgi:hypothetical protein
MLKFTKTTFFILIIILFCPPKLQGSGGWNRFSIMLDPAGDAQNTGRQIDDSLERGITLQFAEQLKRLLEERYPQIRVILTRFPGETIQPLQNANFANRLDIDCYVSIHFYRETQTKPRLFLYRFSYGDDFVTRLPDLSFCPYDQAHQINSATTKAWCNTVSQVLTRDEHKRLFDFYGVVDLPFKPLIGIKAPAFACEAGLRDKHDFVRYLQPMALSLGSLIPS